MEYVKGGEGKRKKEERTTERKAYSDQQYPQKGRPVQKDAKGGSEPPFNIARGFAASGYSGRARIFYTPEHGAVRQERGEGKCNRDAGGASEDAREIGVVRERKKAQGQKEGHKGVRALIWRCPQLS